jgi:hypothetical protein
MLTRHVASLLALVPAALAFAPLAACGGKVSAYVTPSPGDPATPQTTTPAPVTTKLADGGTVTTYSPPASASCTAPALTCSDVFPGAVPFSSATAADLVGIWIDCPTKQSEEYPSTSPDVGEEFAADGTHYAIITNSRGEYVRDEDPSTMGTWKVGPQGGGGAGLLSVIISENDGTLYAEYGLSTCPRALVEDEDLELPAP